MTLNFPTSPSVNDTYTYNGTTFVWDGEKWDASTPFLVNSSNIVDGAITASKLAADSVTAEKVDSSAVERNLIINGAMEVSQRYTSNTGQTATAYRACDRFQAQISALGTWTIEQSSNSPEGFANSFRVECTAADAAPASGDAFLITYYIEGKDLQFLKFGTANARPLNLSFWVRSNKTNSSSISFRQVDNNSRMFTATYDFNSTAGEWKKIEVSVPGDVAGFIDNDNGNGLSLEWWLHGGSIFTGGSATTAWQDFVDADRMPANAEIGGTIGDYFEITGVQLTATDTALPFQHEDYATTLQKCQRYYKQFGPVNNFPLARSSSSGSSGRAYSWWTFSPTMRAAPTVVVVGTFTTGVPQISQTSEIGTRFGSPQTNLAAGASENLVSSPDGGFTFDAEL